MTRILLAQINPLVGAIAANTEAMLAVIAQYGESHDLIVFPELALTGYPPEDLLFRDTFFSRTESALDTLAKACTHTHVLVGHPRREGRECFNSATLLGNGKRLGHYDKQHLPNDGVFDEKRYFTPGADTPFVFTLGTHRVGVCICEDFWQKQPVARLVEKGIDTLVCINASPFDTQKHAKRLALAREHAAHAINVLYVNLAGGQDELVFDGQSFSMNKEGLILAHAPAFATDCLSLTLGKNGFEGTCVPALDTEACLYEALKCGLRDYVEKNRFPGVLLGLSGGIDSALTLAIAVDALGKGRVHAVIMPSRHTAEMSIEDAILEADALGCRYTILPIEPAFVTLTETLAPAFIGKQVDITEENLQARIRGVLLMALSNKSGNMVLVTSNKSETAVGYATLYGDMAGGFAPLKDVCKTEVYALAAFRNRISQVIPERVITRAPSAELAPNQTDQDSLPDYPLLDAILKAHVEENASIETLIARGFPAEDVEHVVRLIARNEYKRRQSAPGVRVSPRAFGRDWRYPITCGF
ncbi:glutamine dependent NAD+ synthetase [Legionella geestiana]|uniref:Glutamine-dependent NAD(+) synthetase n=1 Tax=Legionella geestiana TaxID=45065 RepID=A0A0W0U0L5_9GAMM|nr:NAD+ synthase [Legionella geestiana]KTD01572.1 glutamine dependent NAD+ synthetase [Legionella geestiana]QBS11876.1 NAD+ synthase [Legionella geestiana]STX53422.1 NAD synthase (glutamine-hydrolysing) [Legionella geestiana]